MDIPVRQHWFGRLYRRTGMSILRSTCVIMGAAFALPFLSPTLQAAEPNVLLICVDDLRPQLGAYGKDYMHTPNMDQLAAEGFLFNRAYVQQAVCGPSRMSMLSGLYPDNTKIYDVQTKIRDTVPWVTTLPQHFKNYGYFASGIGKIFHNGLDDAASWSEPHVYLPGNVASPHHLLSYTVNDGSWGRLLSERIP